MKYIKPKIGGYFKYDNLIYLAKELIEPHYCVGCCFHSLMKGHSECSAPNALNCKGMIFEDVTDNVEVELIDERFKGFFKFFVIVAIWLAVIVYTVINYNKYN